jgi:biopolymer transport protein ExbB/TolQ
VIETITVTANTEGAFTLVPEKGFDAGVYSIVLVAELPFGARSASSEPTRIVVELPGYITFGTRIVQALSVIVPLIALLILLMFGTWFLWFRLKRWRKSVLGEAVDAEHKLKVEFDGLITHIHSQIAEIRETRKTKLTRAEESLYSSLEEDLRQAQTRLKKEITDIETIVK